MLLWWSVTLSVPGKAIQGRQQGRPLGLGAMDCSALWELSIGMVEAMYTLGLLPGTPLMGYIQYRVSPLSFIYRVNECQLANKNYLKHEGSFLQNR